VIHTKHLKQTIVPWWWHLL